MVEIWILVVSVGKLEAHLCDAIQLQLVQGNVKCKVLEASQTASSNVDINGISIVDIYVRDVELLDVPVDLATSRSEQGAGRSLGRCPPARLRLQGRGQEALYTCSQSYLELSRVSPPLHKRAGNECRNLGWRT